jgi:hypothetical protein
VRQISIWTSNVGERKGKSIDEVEQRLIDGLGWSNGKSIEEGATVNE